MDARPGAGAAAAPPYAPRADAAPSSATAANDDADGVEDPPQPKRSDAHLAGGAWIIGGPKQRIFAPVTAKPPNGDG